MGGHAVKNMAAYWAKETRAFLAATFDEVAEASQAAELLRDARVDGHTPQHRSAQFRPAGSFYAVELSCSPGALLAAPKRAVPFLALKFIESVRGLQLHTARRTLRDSTILPRKFQDLCGIV